LSVLERIHRLWPSRPDPDHPLSDEERESVLSSSFGDQAGRVGESFVGVRFDPDESHRP
jgi:hypothetical protein